MRKKGKGREGETEGGRKEGEKEKKILSLEFLKIVLSLRRELDVCLKSPMKSLSFYLVKTLSLKVVLRS